MEYRTLGKTGVSVSRVGFGGAPIGIANYLSGEDRESDAFRSGAIHAIHEAVAGGIHYFDTAPSYGDGRSERLIGEALAGQRDKVVLATKFLFDPANDSAAYTQALRESLTRLRTGYVDILQVHGNVWDHAAAESLLTSGALDWLETMRRDGLVRFAGITAEGPSGALERLLQTGHFDILEIAYSIIYQATCDYQREPAGIIPLARSLGMGVAVMRPTTCGVLQKLLCLAFPEIERDRVTELAINFALSTPEVDCVVIGMCRASEVHANVALEADASRRVDLRWLHDRFNQE